MISTSNLLRMASAPLSRVASTTHRQPLSHIGVITLRNLQLLQDQSRSGRSYSTRGPWRSCNNVQRHPLHTCGSIRKYASRNSWKTPLAVIGCCTVVWLATPLLVPVAKFALVGGVALVIYRYLSRGNMNSVRRGAAGGLFADMAPFMARNFMFARRSFQMMGVHHKQWERAVNRALRQQYGDSVRVAKLVESRTFVTRAMPAQQETLRAEFKYVTTDGSEVLVVVKGGGGNERVIERIQVRRANGQVDELGSVKVDVSGDIDGVVVDGELVEADQDQEKKK